LTESVPDLLAQRYRTAQLPALAAADATIATLLGHRSVRRFLHHGEPGSEVTEAHVATMVAAAQSASTSSDVQAWSVIEVRDPERRALLGDLSDNAVHVRQAPLTLVWVADLARQHALLAREPDAAGSPAPPVNGRLLEAGLVSFLDTALAAQNAAVAAESMGLGICYLGGVRNEPEQVAELLGLPAHTFALFGMCVGVPDPDRLPRRRPRLPQSVVRHAETYGAPPSEPVRLSDLEGMAAYDDTVAAFDLERGADRGPGGRWAARMRRRLADVAALHGRERLRAVMRERGFPLE